MIVEDQNEKKPLINPETEKKKALASESDTVDDEPAYRNPDALESFADFYSRKRPSKKLKHKKQIAYDGLYGIIPEFHPKKNKSGEDEDDNKEEKETHNYAEYKSLKYDHVRTILEEQDYE